MAEMRNVVLARVDDRLIHGEVVTAWTPTFRANKIIIIDDEVAKDTFNVRVVKALAPAGTKVIVYNVEKAAEKLMVQGVPGERLLLLAKTPTTYNRLIKAGVPLKEVNLGGAGIRGERQPFINNVALNPEEVLACEEMQKAGVNVYYQLVPEQSVIKIDDALKKAMVRIFICFSESTNKFFTKVRTVVDFQKSAFTSFLNDIKWDS